MKLWAGLAAVWIMSAFSPAAAADAPANSRRSPPALQLRVRWEETARGAEKIKGREFSSLSVTIPYLSFKSTANLSGAIQAHLSNAFQDHRSSVSLDLSEIARNLQVAPLKDLMAAEDRLIALQNAPHLTSVETEPLPDRLQLIAFWTAVSQKRTLDLIAASPRFEELLDRLLSPSLLSYRAHRLVAQDHAPLPDALGFEGALGWGDFIFALGRSLGMPVIAGAPRGEFSSGALHNWALYRAAQYSPMGFAGLQNSISAENWAGLRQDLSELSDAIAESKKRTPAKLKTANLVLELPLSQLPFPELVDPVMNALLANGYQVEVTFGELKEADLHYVLYSERANGAGRLLKEIERLLDPRFSKFNGKLILHPMEEIDNGGAWKDLRTLFGIPQNQTGWIPMPEAVHSSGIKVPWLGAGSRSLRTGMTFIRAPRLRERGGDPVLTETIRANTLTMILQTGRHFLINGNLLHPQAFFFLSQILEGAVIAPTQSYVTSFPWMTAALATADTHLKLKLPASGDLKFRRVMLYDAEGKKSKDEWIDLQETYETWLHAGDLLVLIPGDRPAAFGPEKPPAIQREKAPAAPSKRSLSTKSQPKPQSKPKLKAAQKQKRPASKH